MHRLLGRATEAPLVGREPALRAVERALAALGERRGGALRLAGEPGIGKSRLLGELAARANDRSYLVLEGRAAELEADLPFGVFVDALDDHLAGPGRRALERFEPAVIGHLGAVFPALSGQGEVAPPDTQERLRVNRAVRSLLTRLSIEEPVVLVLDDVHWLDPASAELLAYLVSHPPAGAVLLAMGYRPEALSERLRSAIERGETDGRVLPVALEPLSRDDARLLVGPDMAAPMLDAIHAEAGGNPFYVLELASAAGGRAVPRSVRSAIDRELAALPDAARMLAWGAAVAADPFDVELAATAAALPPRRMPGALDRLVASGLVRETGVAQRMAFRHPLVRRAVYGVAPVGWRVAAHRRLAAALRERGAPAVELARHVEVSAGHGEREAIDVLAAAGHALMRRVPAVAARRFEAALRLLPPDDAEARRELLAPLAAALTGAMRLRESRDLLVEALGLVPADAIVERARLEAARAHVELWIGMRSDRRRRLLAALDSLPDRRSPEAAALMIELAATAHVAGDHAGQRAWAREAADAGRGAARALALAQLALGEYLAGTPSRGLEPLRAAAALFDSLTDDEVAARPDAPFFLVHAESCYERFEQAIQHAERGLAVARATGQGHVVPPTLAAKAWALRCLGRLGKAAEIARDALEGARLAGHGQATALAAGVRCFVAAAEGELGTALAAGEELLGVARQMGSSLTDAAAGWILGEVLLEAGQPTRCVTLVSETLGRAGAAVGGPAVHAWHGLARAEVQRGRHREAQAWIDRLDAVLPGLAPLQYPRTLAERARAEVRLAAGEAAAAARAALAAADAADRIHARLEAGRARLLAGRALGAAGERERAIQLLEQARAELDDCGAQRFREEAERELRRLGRRISRGGGRRPTSAAGRAALSERERQVAELAAAGRTNQAIADELFLSIKTVERHMSNIFRKLGVCSRAQIGTTLQTLE